MAAYGSGSVVEGSLAATGNSRATPFTAGPGYRDGRFNLTVSGTWVGSFFVERSFDGGVTWFPCTNAFATVAPTGNGSEVLIEPEPAVRYAVNFTRTSGTLSYRFSQ